MGEKFPVADYHDTAHVARKCGFYFCRHGKGSHEIWRRDSDSTHTTIPNHGHKELKRRTLKAIITDLGITPEEFNRLQREK